MKTTGKARKPGHRQANGFLKRFVTLWALTSFILSSAPAYASRDDRPDVPRLNKVERLERRAERLAERQLQRSLLPTLTAPRISTPTVQPNLTPVFQNNIRINTIQQRRMERANLVTTKREARQLALQEKLSANQQLSNRSVQTLDSGRVRNINARLNLDLSSAKSNITLGEKLFSSTDAVRVNVGGEEKTFTAGSKVTAAEYASILQVLNGGQTLTLDGNGTATGGTLDFKTITSNGDNLKLSSLVIPEQVVAVGNFSASSDVKLKGDVVNYGSIYAISNRDGGSKATITSGNINNQGGGLISSVANSSLGSDLSSSVDLKLRADDTLSNEGTIESSGDLTLSAGKQIINGDVRGRGTSTATVIAQNNLTIDAPVVSNSGLLAATTGNVNFTSAVDETNDGSILLNNTNGTVQALNGNINFRDASVSPSGKMSTLVTGGSLLSEKLNIHGGDGAVDVRSDYITGSVISKSGTARISAAKGSLYLEDITTSGDPTFTSATDLSVINVTTGGAPVAFVAGGNLLFDDGAVIDTSNGAGAGGEINMIAGAEFTESATEISITGASATGGGIYGFTPGVTLNSSGSTSAGNINLIAFGGSADDGVIFLDEATVTANGGTGANGNITAIGGGTISVGSISNTGGTANTGNVFVSSFQPAVTGPGSEVVIDATVPNGGNITSGSFVAGNTSNSLYVDLGDINTGGTLSINASNDVYIGNVAATSMAATTLGNMNLLGDITAPGGITLVSQDSIFLGSGDLNFDTSSVTSNGGDIVMVAGATFNQDATTITITGSAPGGGDINFGFSGGPATFNTRSLGGNGTGGDVSFIAFGGAIQSVGPITTGGNGTGGNGSVLLVAGGDSGNAIEIDELINTSGGSSALVPGDVTLVVSAPQTGSVIQKSNATYSGAFTGGSLQSGNILVSNNILTANGDISIQTGGGIDVNGTLTTSTGSVNLSGEQFVYTQAINATGDSVNVSGGEVALGAINTQSLRVSSTESTFLQSVSATSTSITSLLDIVINDDINSPLGILMVAGRNIIANVAGINLSTSAAATTGNISIIAGADFDSDATTVTINGASTTGGYIDFDNVESIDTRSLVTNGSAGSITLAAFRGSGNSASIYTNANTAITTGGNGTGNNGSVTIISATEGFDGVNVGPINTTGGNATTGDVYIATATPVTTPAVVFQKSNASTTGSFTTGAVPTTGNIVLRDVTVSSNADTTVVSGASIDAAAMNGGANSVLTLTAESNITLGSTTMGTAVFNADLGVFITGSVAQGPAGSLEINAGGFSELEQITSGAVRISAGESLFLGGAITASSVSALANGFIDIDDDITAPGGILLVAGRNIAPTTPGVTLSTSSASGNAGDMTIIAGADFSQDATSVTINGASLDGGSIDFDFVALNMLTTRSIAANAAAGDMTLIAFAGTDGFSGRIFTDEFSVLDTSGNGTGANGTFTAIGNASDFFAVGINGLLDTTGSAANTGDVYIAAADPVTTTPVVIQKSNAAVTAGAFQGGALTAADVFTDDIIVANGADVTIRSGGSITISDVIAGANSILTIDAGQDVFLNSSNAGTVTINAGGFVTPGSFNQGTTGVLTITAGDSISVGEISSGTVRLSANGFLDFVDTVNISNSLVGTATGTIGVAGNVTARSILLVAGENIISTNTGINISTASATGNGGDITLVAGAAFTEDATTVMVTGASATGGGIDFDFFGVNSIDTSSSALNGSGGDLTMVSFLGSDINSGFVFTDFNGTITTGGSGTGSNGDITAIGGNDVGDAIGLRGTINTTGGSAFGTGNVFAAAATPDTTPAVVIAKSDASISSGDFRGGPLTGGAAWVDNVTVGGGARIDIQTDGFAEILDLTGGPNSTAFVSAGSSVRIEDMQVGNLTLLARTFIALSGTNVRAPGGILMVAGGDIFPEATGLTISTDNLTGNAGDLTLIAGAEFTQDATSVTVTGASATGGRIDLDFNNVAAVTANAGAGNFNGGNITLVSLFGTADTGEIFTDANTVINAAGASNGSNGTITMVSSKNNGDSGLFLNGDISLIGGAQGTGEINLSTSALPGPVTFSKSNASITAGTVLGGALTNSSINSEDLTIQGGDINVRSGARVVLGALNVSGNGIADGGNITISTAADETLLLSDVGFNSVASLSAAGGSTSGNGGTINVTATGAGGITVGGNLNVGATEGDGGDVTLSATNGDIVFDGATSINVSGATLTATPRAAGSIELVGDSIVATGAVTLTANGVAGGAGGTIEVTTNGSDIVVGTGAGQLILQAVGPNGTIDLTANGGGDINVLATGSISTDTVNLTSASGTITINGGVTGANEVNLSVGGTNTISGTALVNSATLTVTAGTGSTIINTNVGSLTLATNGSVSITEVDDITVNTGTTGAGTFSLNATGDDIIVGGTVTANGGINLTTSGTGTITGSGTLVSAGQLAVNAGTGLVDLNTNVASFAASTSGSVIIDETNAITLNAITADSLDVTANVIAHGSGVIAANTINFSALAGDIGAALDFIQINNGANPVNLTAVATGDIYINIAGAGTLLLGATTGNDITLTAAGPITTTGNVTATGTLDITTNSLTNEYALSGDIVNIQSNTGSGLSIDGGSGGTINGNEINITATFGNLTFSGILDFFGPTTLTAVAAPGAVVIVTDGADIEGHDSVTVVSNGLVEEGTGVLTGDPLIITQDFFTIANSTGDVNLFGDIVFSGQSLAILARGNVNIAGTLTLIDLSALADSGDLFIVAGYDFTPTTGGQVISGAQYTLVADNQSPTGGNINLGAADINLSSVNGAGGNLTAVATTGNTNNGTIQFGDIDVSSTNGASGNVLIIGEGGVSVGNIDATGGTTDGTVELAVAVPNIVGGNILVTDGVATGGEFQATTLSPGNMTFGDISASEVTLVGAQGAGNTISQNGLVELIADTLNIRSGVGTVTLGFTAVDTINVAGNGGVSIANNLATTIGTVTSSAGTLSLSVAANNIITTSGAISGIAALSLEAEAPTASEAIFLGGNVTTSSSITLTANGGADLTLDNRTLTSDDVSLNSTAGDVNLASTGIINAGGDAAISASNSFAIAGTIIAQTVALTSGDDIVTGDITGTITAPAGTFLVSTNGGIGTDENNRFVTNSTNLLLSAGNGDIYVSSINTTGVDVTDVSASGKVDIITAGPVTLHDVTTGNGDIQVVQNGIGALTVAAGASLNTTEGDIILTNNDLNKKTGKIIIDDGATIKASGTTAGVGEVYITMGPIPAPPYKDRKKPPKGVTINEVGGGGVFLGKKGIDTRKETNITLNALNRDLVFSLSGKLNKKAIHVGSNVTITADPPGDIVPTATRAARSHSLSMPVSLSAVDGSQSAFDSAQSAFGSTQFAFNSAFAGSMNAIDGNRYSSVMASDIATSLTSSALQTDLNKSSQSLLAEKTGSVAKNTLTATNDTLGATDDALAAIFGEDSEDLGYGCINAIVVSEALPNAAAPNVHRAGHASHTLSESCAVYVPVNNVEVKTSHANIAIAAGSVVLVVSGSNGVSVYDLHDSKKEAVKVSFHNQTIALSPGRHATVCANEKRSYADANLAEAILHRSVVSERTTHGGSLFTSEFAVNSAIDCVPALRALLSSQHPACAKIAAKLNKTQAIILYLSQSQEEFQQHVKSQITAMR